MTIFVVIPLFNESRHIAYVINGIGKYKLPVVIVDDGSTDYSSAKIKQSKATLLTHTVNLGKGSAMKTGADYAFNNGADAIIFMDADGQHEPDDLAIFIQKLKTKKYDVVFGSRNLVNKAPFVRLAGNKIAAVVINLLFGINISDPICGFRAITKKAYYIMHLESCGYSIKSEILARVAQQKLKFAEIPVRTIYHDKDKGVTILDAFGVLGDVIKWWLTP